MCQASIVADDWVVKGCHIHIGATELVVYPNHLGGVNFKPFFTVKQSNKHVVGAALKTAREQCINDPDVRKSWIRSLKQAIRCMLSFDGELKKLANGRMLEFKFLIVALERY